MTELLHKPRGLMSLALPPYVYVVVIGVLAASYIPLFLTEQIIDLFAREDGIEESLTAVYFLLAGIAAIAAYVRSGRSDLRTSQTKIRRLSYLGLAAFMVIAAGEEISWGQRILGIETPNLIKGVNVQQELTLHNMNIFQGDDAIIPVSMSQIFTGVSFLYALVIPFCAVVWTSIKQFLERFVPVIPFSVGIFFAINYGFQKSLLRLFPAFPQLYHHSKMRPPVGIHEIREHNYAIAWLVVILYILFVMLASRHNASSEPTQEPLATS